MLYVEFTLLGRHGSDPPDVPSLQEAGQTLQTLVNTGTLSVRFIICLYTVLLDTLMGGHFCKFCVVQPKRFSPPIRESFHP